MRKIADQLQVTIVIQIDILGLDKVFVWPLLRVVILENRQLQIRY